MAADGTITFSTALDNGQLEKDIKAAQREIDALKGKIEKARAGKSAIEQEMERAKAAADEAGEAVGRLRNELGVTSDEQLAQDLREATREATRLQGQLSRATDRRDGLAEQMDRAEAKIHETEGAVARLKERLAELEGVNPARVNATEWTKITQEAAAARQQIASGETELQKQVAAIDRLNERWQSADASVDRYARMLDSASQRREKLAATSGRLGEANASLKEQESELRRVQGRWETASRKVDEYGRDVVSATARAKELEDEYTRAATSIRAKVGAAADHIRGKLTGAAKDSGDAFERMAGRIKSMMRRAFVFTVILSALRAVKDALGEALMQNERFAATWENLKATVRGVASGIANLVAPALIAVVNTFVGLVERLAGLVDTLFGTNILGTVRVAQAAGVASDGSSSTKAAKSTKKQADAAKKLAKEQEKANRQLLAFDEINALASDAADDAADSYDDDAGAIGGGGLAPDYGFLGGVFDWLDELRRRIETDVEGPFARIREGMERIAKGWSEVVEGFKTGNLGLIWKGITDTIVGGLYVFDGAVNALMDWLDEITGGRFTDIFQGMGLVVHGFVELADGLLGGDFALAVQGMVDMVEGAAQTLHGVIDALSGFAKGAVNIFFDYLEDMFPQFTGLFEGMRDFAVGIIDGIGEFLHKAVDGAVGVIEGALDVVVGLVTFDAERVLKGLRKFGDGLLDGLDALLGLARKLISVAFDALRSAIDGAFNFLAAKFPAAARLFYGIRDTIKAVLSVIEGAVRGAINLVGGVVRGALDGLVGMARGAADVVVGAFTGAGDRIIRGLKGMVNGFASILEGLCNGIVSGIVGFVNGIVGGLNYLPGVDIPSITFRGVRLPRLAQGAVIPPNREFLAVLGDQRSGNNIEAPEPLMRQVVREEAGAMLAEAIMALQGGGGEKSDIVLMVGHTELARAALRGMRDLDRTGELGGFDLAFV